MAASTTVQLAGYQILEQIYASPKTLVYRAQRAQDRQPVMIKVLQNEYPSFTELAQFRNQYTIAKILNLPEVVQTYSLESYKNGYALIMEDFGGVSLKEATRRWRQGEPGSATDRLQDFLRIALQIVSGLNGLYRNRVIHKDIKPDNILINPETQQVKLIDFSIASLLPKESQVPTNPAVLEGTLAYISPEQTGRMNRAVDYRTDFYSLGVTFYELLIGQLPFQATDAMELIHCHLAKQPPSIHSLNPIIPPALSAIVSKLMAKNAEDRYQSALGLKHDLEICLQQLEATGNISVFELGQQDVCDRFTLSEKLYGRQADVDTLLAAYDRITTGSSEILLVAGFSGIGKTAIVNEVHKPIVRQRGYFIKGKFDQFQRNIPFSAVVQAFQDLMAQVLKEDRQHIEAWQAQILEAIGDNGQVIIEVIPEVELLIGKQPPLAVLDPVSAQHRLNWVFQKFIQVFPSAAHPLVIFLDDLQWADSASLKLIQTIMAETETQHLLLIGAYRDNEVNPVHPLMLTLNEIQKSKTAVNTITLSPLSLGDLNHLVADSLHAPLEGVYPLTQLVYTKTKGNPFFSNQFLKALYESELITFNFDAGAWQWDLAQVQAQSLTEDVVDFMAAQLQKLPEATQTMLKLAACIGNQFDLKTLAFVSGQSPTETAGDLWEALQAGLILPGSDIYKLFQDANPGDGLIQGSITEEQSLQYRFLHDRVQQAAYRLIPAAQKTVTHLKIGQLLLRNTPVGEREENIFEIVNQLNYGVDWVRQAAERNELAQLNLIAAQKAIATTAYNAAVDYATTGIQLLQPNSWQRQYVFTLALYEAAIVATSLCGRFDQMEELAEVALQRAKTPLDCLKIYETRIQAYTSQNRLLAALDTARQVLTQFQVHFPDQPTPADIGQAFQATSALLAGKTIEDLSNLPLMTSLEQQAVNRIAVSMIPAAYIAAPALFPLIILLLVNSSVVYGNTPLSAFGYASYSLLLNSITQDFETADQFGKLALKLSAKFNSKAMNVRTYYVLGAFIIHVNAHLRETLPLLLQGYQAALETGNLEFVGYCVKDFCQNSYFIGEELTGLESEIGSYSHTLESLQQTTSLGYCQIFWQVTLNLLGKSEHPCLLRGTAFDEEAALPALLEANNLNGLHYFYLHKLILSYLFGDYVQAIDLQAKAEQYLTGGTGFASVPMFYFYDSLTVLAVAAPDPSGQSEGLKRVADNQAKLQKWAHHAPMNHSHKYDLVEAERQRVLGDRVAAMELYDRAYAQAREFRYLNDEALICELTAKFYLSWDKETIAQAYMVKAYQAYEQWGAQAKLADLAQRYPHLLTAMLKPTDRTSTSPDLNHQLKLLTTIGASESIGHTTNNSSSSISEVLDLATVLKASQVLSGEIQLEHLLTRLMQVVIENAGAQTGALMLCQGEDLVIQAQAKRSPQEGEALQITSLQAIPVQSSPAIPGSLINYVSRTLKTLVIDDVATETTFADDPYILEHQPKAILCTPLRRQGRLVGILYLENNLTRGAFTHDRLQILKLLTTQAAISLENALLYENLAEAKDRLEDYNSTLEQRVAERTQALNQKTRHLEQAMQELQRTQTQLVQAEKMSSLGQLVAGIAHEINNPINFIHGNLVHTSRYVQDLFEVISAYQQEYPDPNPKIAAVIQQVDLDFAIEDLPKLIHSMNTGSDRIRDIVLGLRNFSRLDEAEMKPVDIHEGIDSALMILQHRLKTKPDSPNIEIIKEYADLPLVECYAGQLNQVFMNILSNAIDALENQQNWQDPADRTPQIRISTQQIAPDRVQVEIVDNGPGMTEEVRQKIFDPFFTTKPVGSGTGLGLSISYQIVVDRHKGRLTCQSDPNQGTTFMIEVPITN
ncbi:serine/threonine protein kinase [Leptolyngbya sp. 'hensonii']|uniref:trifunctional serine/threonine-protein kinase/ATP-binding protein/sensor histidine kinase n=1 Tax=Leptolyngbya sp. 'hensonii' TaxID=1922337 RepID=UPI00094FBDB3|nr:ATP-binding sensor histidine kinase [Leptolyngbya sp. 'hensonii']OLP15517.1 serine/threonine protein kinase [Leptolyngbya sp. 'hensonii']